MKKINSMMDELFKDFVGIPNGRPIVRNNTRNDAFTLAILKVMYADLLKISVEPQNIAKISEIVVAPPDSGIDLFVEIEMGDEYMYKIVQAKFSSIDEATMKGCFAGMKQTIEDYLKDSSLVTQNLKDVISNTSFDKSKKGDCEYIVVHIGDLDNYKSLKKDETIINKDHFNLLTETIGLDAGVPYDEIRSDAFSNYMEYKKAGSGEGAILCNLRGYDLAKLCNKYIDSDKGRNVLFGKNLRESLTNGKAKKGPAKDMEETILKEPQRFWHYNNGITIIAENLDLEKKAGDDVGTIKLKNFSIINGAQTTSALGRFLRDAQADHNIENENKLKEVFVLARLMEVTDKELSDNIAIYNNSQNAISSRDMVSRRVEQLKLYDKMISNTKEPHIYVEIKNGENIPAFPKFEKHQQTTNEKLAQLAFAAFLLKPFDAKDKKKSLFVRDATKQNVLINEHYQEIFSYPQVQGEPTGILFSKTREEIDEALFVKYLYDQAKGKNKKAYEKRIEAATQKIKENKDQNPSADVSNYEKQIQISNRSLIINSNCLFYCISLYFSFKDAFNKQAKEYHYDYMKFYNSKDKTYRDELVDAFTSNFLQKTIEIISGLIGPDDNEYNWLRRSKSEGEFMNKLNADIVNDMQLEEKFDTFVQKYKTVQWK